MGSRAYPHVLFEVGKIITIIPNPCIRLFLSRYQSRDNQGGDNHLEERRGHLVGHGWRMLGLFGCPIGIIWNQSQCFFDL